MTAHVILHPSGHEFVVEGADTLLEAALHSGLAVNYGCSNGNCGLCKARVVSGEVTKVRHHDYRLSEAEKSQGYILLCSHTAQGELVLETLETGSAGDIPQQEIDARIKVIEPLGEGVRLLHLQTPRNNRLRYFSGQSATLIADGAAARLPIASCPCDERNLHFHVRRDEQDEFACAVFDRLASGDSVRLVGPFGDFVLRTEPPRPMLFIAGETGFAPVKGLIEHAMSLDRTDPLRLYWHSERPDGRYLDNLCRAWADAFTNFSYIPESGGTEALVARIAGEHADLAAFDMYLAGPPVFVDGVATALAEAGFPAAQLSVTKT